MPSNLLARSPFLVNKTLKAKASFYNHFVFNFSFLKIKLINIFHPPVSWLLLKCFQNLS